MAESTAEPLSSSSCTSPTWPSFAARCRALSPFCKDKATAVTTGGDHRR